jgi:hypothetical protein
MQPTSPNLNKDPTKGRIRRITDVLHQYWDNKRGDRPYPMLSDINPDDLDDVWNSCFVVQLHHIQNKENYCFTYFGEILQRAYTRDLTDVAIKYLVTPHADHLAEQYEKVLKTGEPIIDESSYENRDHITVSYRQCLLPVGLDDDGSIGFILGGIRYKLQP